MRKTKVFALLATVLVAAMLLTACAVSSAKSFDKVLNPDFRLEEDMLVKSADAISELNDYQLDDHNEFFAVFTKADDETGDVTTKVYSLLATKIILTVTDSETDTVEISYDIDLHDTLPLIAVLKGMVTQNEDDVEEETVSIYSLYDAQGSLITSETIDEDTTMTQISAKLYPIEYTDLVIINFVAYEVDDTTGAFTKKMDMPEYMFPANNECSIEGHDEYYYISFEDTDGTFITVYDKSFNYVSMYCEPYFAYDMHYDFDWYVLNDGNLFIQYAVELDEDAKDFDYYYPVGGATLKMGLHTLIFDVKEGKAKEIDFDYIIWDILPQFKAYDAEDNNNYFNDSFDNIAWVYPIVDGQVDWSDASADMFLMTNNGKLKKSLKLVDRQEPALPDKIGDNLYRVSLMNGGVALIDIDGNVKKILNNSDFEQVGQYFKTGRALYDLNWNVVYNFLDNKVTDITSIGDTVFVTVGNDEQYSVLSFRNGTQTTVMSYDATNETNDELKFTEFGYVIHSNGDFNYYNVAGERLLTTTTALTLCASSDDSAIYKEMATVEDILKPIYYIFKK